MFKNNVPAVVSGLLFRSRPAAIAWFVVAIIVLAVNGQAWGIPIEHVGNEVVRIMPTLANSDAASTIAGKAFVCGLCAAGHHATPYPEERLSPGPVLGDTLYVEAAAALRGSIPKGVYANVARRNSAGALSTGKEVPSAIAEDPEYRVAPVSIANLHIPRTSFNHSPIIPLIG